MLGAASLIVLAPALADCDGDGDAGLSAWAGTVRDTMRFRQSVAWVEPNDLGGRTAALAFVPFDMDASQRHAVLANKGVYPVLSREARMLEVRLVMEKLKKGQPAGVSSLRRVDLTFWNFAEPTPVVSVESKDWATCPDVQVDGFEGNVVPGGWLDGTIRGKAVVAEEARHEAYVWNLQVATSLD